MAITGAQPVTGFKPIFKVFGQGYLGSVPVPTLIVIAMLVPYWLVMNKRRRS